MKVVRTFVMSGSPDAVFRACQRTVRDMKLRVKSMTGHTMVLGGVGLNRLVTLEVEIRGRRDDSSNLGILAKCGMGTGARDRKLIEEFVGSFANGVDVELRQAGSRTASSAPEPPPAEPEFSVADELGKLADLRDRGVLSEEEFEEQKMKLLE
tara:strand:+ start:539 stop:997 length:459 start_codon:yes stop_codon:yes gene_type:complete